MEPDYRDLCMHIDKLQQGLGADVAEFPNGLSLTLVNGTGNNADADPSEDPRPEEAPDSDEEDSKPLVRDPDAPTDYRDVCRICTNPGVTISIFDNEETLRMCEKVTSCAAVQIERDDGLPGRICAACASDLEVAFDFKSRCERSDALLREKLGVKTKTIVKTEFVLIDCDEEDASDRATRRIRSKKNFGDDFVRDDDFSDGESEPAPSADVKRKRFRKKRKAASAKIKEEPVSRKRKASEPDSEDDVILVSNVPPKKRKQPSTTVDRYPCDYCDKSFPYPSVLKLHAVTHTKEKIHKCMMCPEAFVYSKNLYAHYKEVHPNESMKVDEEIPKSFPCGTCDKVFGQAKNLKVHEAMHLREKKYKCDGCGLGFTNMSILTVHKKREHPHLIQSLNCSFCNRSFKKQSSLERHLDNHRRTSESGNSGETKKPPLMKDLFKSIAPLTTTYWSDSFSD